VLISYVSEHVIFSRERTIAHVTVECHLKLVQ
jgi:hypothetical protein